MNSANQKMQQIFNLLLNENEIGKERITMVKTFSDKKESVQLWLVPTGAMPPMPKKK